MSLRRLTAAILGAAVAGAALGHTRGLRSGMAIGYAYGDRDGQRRGDANARLDMILAAPIGGRASRPSDADNTHPAWCLREAAGEGVTS